MRRLAAGRLALLKGEIDKRFALRHGKREPSGRSRIECLSLHLHQGLQMGRIQNNLVTVISAVRTGDLHGAFQNPNQCVGGDQH